MKIITKLTLMLGVYLIFSTVSVSQIYNKPFKKSSKRISGSIVCNTRYIPGTTMDLDFTLNIESPDYEWGDQVTIIFPIGFTPNSASDSLEGEKLVSINGRTVTWGDNDNTFGGASTGSIPFTVNVTIAANVSGEQYLDYFVSGDEYGGFPHSFSGKCIMQGPVTCTGNDVKVTIKIHTDTYGTETTWKLTSVDGVHVYGKGGPYAKITGGKYYEEYVCVPGGTEVEFTIFDEYGDGICCSYDSGYYIVETPCFVAKTGSMFNDEEATVFTVPYSLQAEYNYEAKYGGTRDEFGKSPLQVCDGGYVMTGTTESYGAGGRDVYLIKIDAKGKLVWQKYFGGIYNDYGQSVIQTFDEGYIIAAQTAHFDNSWSKMYIIRTTKNGDTLWTKRIGTGLDYIHARSIIKTKTNQYVIAGFKNDDAYLVCINDNGNIIWEKTYGGSEYDEFTSVTQTSDKKLLAVGYSKSYDVNEMPLIYFVKTDSIGNQIYYKTYGDNYKNYGSRVIETSDKKYVICGYTKNSSNYTNTHTIKTDTAGTVIWTKKYFGKDDVEYAYDIKQTVDNGFIITGYSGIYDYKNENWTFWTSLIKLNSNGDTVWVNRFDGDYKEAVGYGVIQTGDLGFAIAGYTLNQKGKADIYFLKTKPDGVIEYVYQNNRICIVTVDPETNKNVVAWEKTYNEGIASYNIYKESSYAGVYNLIGNVKFDSVSQFVDKNSNPDIKADRYKITAVNAHGYESELSPAHKTMHLTINKGLTPNVYNLIWSNYEGFSFGTYYILRGTNKNNMVQIGDIQSNLSSYTDYSAPPGVVVYYKVVVVKNDTCYVTGKTKVHTGPYSQSMSNIDDNKAVLNIDEINSKIVSVFPNPVKNEAVILFNNDDYSPYTLTISDITGNIIKNVSEIIQSEYHLNTTDLPSGFYFIQLIGKDNYKGKIIIEK